MCLLKVYLDEGSQKRLIAKEVALIIRDGDKIKLRNIEFEDVATLEHVNISLIDTLNSMMIVEPKRKSS